MALSCERSQMFVKIFFYQHHLSFSNEPNPKLNLRTVINNNKISLWLQPEMYPWTEQKRVSMYNGHEPGHCNSCLFTNQTERCYNATTSHPFKYPPCFHAHACAETTHIPKCKACKQSLQQRHALTDSLHTHTGHSGSLVLHQCRLFTPSIHGADTSPQAMRLINFSEFQRAAPPLGLERAPLYSTLHQQEAATLQPHMIIIHMPRKPF